MIGLVIEGGANRTYYSIGVLDALLDSGVNVDFVVGVSAGIANGTSFVSGQKGRALEIGLRYVPDKRYMGFKYFFKKGNKSYYNRDFIFNSIPNELVPFDYDSFDSFSGKVYAVVTNLENGRPEYIEVSSDDKEWKLIQASCALPFMFSPIEINGKSYFDGGCSDPLPVKFAFENGCDKIIAILTREEEYQKKDEKDVAFSSMIYRKKRDFALALKNRSKTYNNSKDFLFKRRDDGTAFVFTPENTRGWKRTEKDPEKLKMMYDEGYMDGIKRGDELAEFLKK